jgi:hypothetical protein
MCRSSLSRSWLPLKRKPPGRFHGDGVPQRFPTVCGFTSLFFFCFCFSCTNLSTGGRFVGCITTVLKERGVKCSLYFWFVSGSEVFSFILLSCH